MKCPQYLRRIFPAALLWLAIGAPASAQLSIRKISVTSNDPFELRIQTSAPVTPQSQIVSSPERLVIDIPNAVPGSGLRGLAIRQAGVRGVRVGLFSQNPPVTRIVVDLSEPQWYRITPDVTGLKVSLGVEQESKSSAPQTVGWVLTKVSAKSAAVKTLTRTSTANKPEKNIVVNFVNGQLTIHAHGATLSEVLFAIEKETGAQIAVPAGTELDHVAADFGPGPAAEVMGELLNGSGLNFVVVGSEADPTALRSVILSRKSDMPAPPVAVAQSFTPPTDEATVETVDSVQDEQAPVPAPMEAPQPQEAPPNGAPGQPPAQ